MCPLRSPEADLSLRRTIYTVTEAEAQQSIRGSCDCVVSTVHLDLLYSYYWSEYELEACERDDSRGVTSTVPMT